MKRTARMISTVILAAFLGTASANAAPARLEPPVFVNNLAYDAARHSLVLDITGPVTISSRVLKAPPRLVVDIPSAALRSHNRELVVKDQLIQRVRVSQWQIIPPVVRVVIETAPSPAEPMIAVQQTTDKLYITLAPARAHEDLGGSPVPQTFTPPPQVKTPRPATPAPVATRKPTPKPTRFVTPKPGWRTPRPIDEPEVTPTPGLRPLYNPTPTPALRPLYKPTPTPKPRPTTRGTRLVPRNVASPAARPLVAPTPVPRPVATPRPTPVPRPRVTPVPRPFGKPSPMTRTRLTPMAPVTRPTPRPTPRPMPSQTLAPATPMPTWRAPDGSEQESLPQFP